MLNMYNDETNVLGFYGLAGVGPSQHTKNELLSTIKFGDLANKINSISSCLVLPRLSGNPHFSCFFGRVVFRNLDSTVFGFLDTSYANSGLDVQSFADYVDVPLVWVDTTNSTLTIPIVKYYIPRLNLPSVMLSIHTDSTRLSYILPEYYEYDSTASVLYLRLFDSLDGTYKDHSFLSSLQDQELSLDVFGVKNLRKENI